MTRVPERTAPEQAERLQKAKAARDTENVSLDDVKAVASLFREFGCEGPGGYLHELLEDSQLEFPAEPPREEKRDPAFLRRLEELRIKAERLELFGPEKVERASMGSIRMELGLGLNIVILMGTSFFVMYYVGNKMFPGNKVYPTLLGAAGMVGILVIETILIITRDERSNIAGKTAAKRDRRRLRSEAARELRVKAALEQKKRPSIKGGGGGGVKKRKGKRANAAS